MIVAIGKSYPVIAPIADGSRLGDVIVTNVTMTRMNGILTNGLKKNGLIMNKTDLRYVSLIFCPLFLEIGISYEAVTNTINIMLPFLRLVIRLKNWPDFETVWKLRSRIIF